MQGRGKASIQGSKGVSALSRAETVSRHADCPLFATFFGPDNVHGAADETRTSVGWHPFHVFSPRLGSGHRDVVLHGIAFAASRRLSSLS